MGARYGVAMKFQHDCSGCVPLGEWTGPSPRWEDEREETLELYACAGKFSVSLIARYGDSPEEYLSGEAFRGQVIGSEPLQEAYRRYRKLKCVD